MIKGQKKINLTVENVLKRVSEYDIFHQFMPGQWKLNQATNSPFRNDVNPSFLIGNKNGYLCFIDFAAGQKGDCFEFVKQLYNLSSIDEVLELIDKTFGLGFLPEHDTREYVKIISEYQQPEEETGKHYSLIQVITRKFTNSELSYWNDYYQDIQDLKDNHIYSISKVYLNRQLFPLKETELRFGYLYGNSWKIYRPHGTKKSKWTPNNVKITEMDGKEDIINCGTAFITKSKKDYLLLKKIFPCVCAVQSENIGCFSPENVEYLKANSDRQILGFDSDQPGVSSSQQITKMFGFGYCNVPRKYLPEINDFADWGKTYGLKVIEDYLKEKSII